MADPIDPNIQQSIEETSDPAQIAAMQEQVKDGPIYKLDADTKVPVSKHEGTLWKARKTGGIKRMQWIFESWSEAEAYYSAGQMDHRRVTGGMSKGNDVTSKNRNRRFSSTDNQVYATVNAVIPSIYAKNPEVEITMNRADLEMFNAPLKRFGNNLIAREDAPGINLKPKARKGIMRCEVTNEAWVMLGYVMREDSAEAAREDIARIGQELLKAESEDKIRELEGQLLALEESCDVLDPAGPFVKSIRGDQVIVDDASCEDDHSDANWMMVQVHLATSYLNARYRQKDAQGNYVSPYKASHVVDARSGNGEEISDVQRQVDTFHIFQQGQDVPKAYGYDNNNAYERAKMTLCWYCFDKVKRRFYLYADNDFTWPIWVFDDPYHLPNFFPLRKLQYHTDPKLTRTKGEVSHYLDQQDDINVISDELNRARTALQDRYWADSRLDQKKIEELMLSTERKVVSLKVPEGAKLADLIMSPPLPTLQFQHVWDKDPAMRSINQISGIGDAQRGEQFRTNTTNKAIEYYSSNSNVRLDEKRDAIEDWIGKITWDVIFLCLQFMPMEKIAQIAGEPPDSPLLKLTNMPAQELRETFTCRCVGGSTQKPTSGAKKAEALQVGQIIGQFAGLPYAQLLVIKNFARAFDGMTVTAQDWQMLLQTMMMGLQQAGAGPQGATPPGSQQGPDDEVAEGEGQQGPTEDEMIKEIIARAKASGGTVTPMQAKQALRKRAQNGAPQTH